MAEFANAGFADPIATLVAAVLVAALLTGLAVRSQARARAGSDPLSSLFERSTFEQQAKAVERRAVKPNREGAILRGRLVGEIWGHETRDEAIAQVAQVIRAGVREGDEVTPVMDGADGDGSFDIVAKNATEAEASSIAQRLIQTLAQTQLGGFGHGVRLTASFGVAGRRSGESDAAMRARADAALNAAQGLGEEYVLAASDWEEVVLLPAPTPTASGSEPGDSLPQESGPDADDAEAA